ncbi:ATPase, partial [mine drainage metagenome]
MYNTIKRLSEIVPKRNILYINFENENLFGMTVEDTENVLFEFQELSKPDVNSEIYLFLDEIQVIPNWSKWINRLYESKKYRIFISGSSSKLLAQELSSELRGRSIDFTVLPFSFSEYLSIRKVDTSLSESFLYSDKRGTFLSCLEKFMQIGGYLEIVNMPDYRGRLLDSYLDTMVIKDVGERFKIE